MVLAILSSLFGTVLGALICFMRMSPPMTACRIRRTGLETLDIAPVWTAQALIATWGGIRVRSASVPATPRSRRR